MFVNDAPGLAFLSARQDSAAGLFRVPSQMRLVGAVAAEIIADSPVVAIRGEPGVGKTSLVRLLTPVLRQHRLFPAAIGKLDQGDSPAITQHLQRRIGELAEIGDADSLNPAEFCRAVKLAADARRLVLVVDDAHLLSAAAFRCLVLLRTVFEHEAAGLSLVLVGNPGRWPGLEQPDLQQIRQQSFSRHIIYPLSPEEAAALLRHRLGSAGGRTRRVLSRAATLALVLQAEGVPATLIGLLEQVLARRARLPRRVTLRMVWPAVSPERSWLVPLGLAAWRSPHGIMASALLLLAAAGAVGYLADQRLTARVASNLLPPATGSVRLAGTDLPQASATRQAEPSAPTQPTQAPPPQTTAETGPALKSPDIAADQPSDTGSATATAASAGQAPPPVRSIHGGPGLVLVAGAGDDLQSLYAKVYRGVVPPPYADLLAANHLPIKEGSLLIFPEPPNGWHR